MRTDRFERAIAAIDAANARDPNRILVRGSTRPKELAHAELATDWVQKLDPESSEELLLAARAHHIERWTRPRQDYPAGRTGYLRWRKNLQDLHAVRVGEILTEQGYDEEAVARVQELVRKRDLKQDPEVQVLEDALCLIFLETQLHELVERLSDDEKVIDVLVKSLRKMSAPGRRAALELDYLPADRALLDRALERARI